MNDTLWNNTWRYSGLTAVFNLWLKRVWLTPPLRARECSWYHRDASNPYSGFSLSDITWHDSVFCFFNYRRHTGREQLRSLGLDPSVVERTSPPYGGDVYRIAQTKAQVPLGTSLVSPIPDHGWCTRAMAPSSCEKRRPVHTFWGPQKPLPVTFSHPPV